MQTCSFSIQLPYNSLINYRVITCRTLDGKEITYSFGFNSSRQHKKSSGNKEMLKTLLLPNILKLETNYKLETQSRDFIRRHLDHLHVRYLPDDNVTDSTTDHDDWSV